jgi:hypothetical protein
VQLDRIAQLSTLRNVTIAVLPEDLMLPVVPLHGFRIHDDEMVSIELHTGAVRLHDPADIAYYRDMFDRLDAVAEHGDQMRRRQHRLASAAADKHHGRHGE